MYQMQRGEVLQNRWLRGREITVFEVVRDVYAIRRSDGKGERCS